MGAGYDATYFQLAVDHPDLIQRVKYVELDLPEVTFNKLRVIKTNPMLANMAGIPETAQNECNTPMFCSDTFSIHPADLRRLHDVDHALKAAQVLGNAPTLILLECVAVYMEHHEGNALLKWVADKFTMDAAIAIYEQYNPNDAFGKQMMLNLSIRGCPLRGILPSLSDHVQRLKSAGWHQAVAHSMNDVWKLYIHPLEKRRVQQLEFLDELEEWELLQSHYCIAVATKSEESTDLFKNYLDFPNLGFS